MENLVSVLIPCYNGEKFLERFFRCLFEQSYKYLEIIFVNDGSKDRSEILAKKYGKQLEKKGITFTYIYQENNGAASAINTALKYVNGEYIMLYDVDDIIFPDAIKEKVTFLQSNKDYDMVRNNGYIVNNNNLDEVLQLFSENDYEKNNEYIFEDLILGKTNNWPASFMIRSDALFKHIKNKEIYISQFGQNLQVMLPVAYFGKSGYIDKPLMKYIRHTNSHSDFSNKEKKLKLMNGYEENRVEIIKQLNIPEEEKEKYFKEIAILYYRIRMQIAYQTKDIELFKQEYDKLVKSGENNKQDKELYYRTKSNTYDKFYSLSHRVVNKLKRGIHK